MSEPSEIRAPAGEPSDLHETIVEHLFDGVYYVDRQRRITHWNPAAERITGFGAGDVVGRRCFDNILGHVDDAGTKLCQTACPLVRSMAQRRGVEAEVFLHHSDGHRVPVHVRCQPVREPDGTIVGAVEIFSESRNYREVMHNLESLRRLSSTDGLTGLLNRRAAELSLRVRLRETHEAGWPLGLLFVDLDCLKRLNDSHGHAAGDAVLTAVARSFAGGLRESDLAGRWGGDEFVVITAADGEPQIREVAERIRHLVAASEAIVNGHPLAITVSVGAALATARDTHVTLVARADRAMYAGKSAGGDRTVVAQAAAPPVP